MVVADLSEQFTNLRAAPNLYSVCDIQRNEVEKHPASMEIRSQIFCIYSSRLNHLSYKLIAWNLTSAVALASVFAVGAGADHALLDLGLVD